MININYTDASTRYKQLKQKAKRDVTIRNLTSYEISHIIYKKLCKSPNHTIPVTPLIKKYGTHHNIKNIINEHSQTYKWIDEEYITFSYL